LLCLIIVFSFIYEGFYGLVLAVVFGALLDIATSQYFGIQTISFVFAFSICAFFRRIFNHEKILPDMLMAVLATPICAFFVWLVYHVAGSPVSVQYTVDSLPVLMISQTILVGILHLIFVRSVIRHRKDRRRERFIL
jgi:rod shape-determining protein MreD